jgi:hypothetical protein
MPPKKFGRQVPFNDTVIREGKIVRLRKDGRIKAIVGEYTPRHPKKITNV